MPTSTLKMTLRPSASIEHGGLPINQAVTLSPRVADCPGRAVREGDAAARNRDDVNFS